METAQASACVEHRSRLKGGISHCFCNWKMGAIRERGSVCEIISCLFFFSFFLDFFCPPQHVSMCHQSVTMKNENLSAGGLFTLQVR